MGLAATCLLDMTSIPAMADPLSSTVWWNLIGRDLRITNPTFTSVSSGSFSGNSATVTPGSQLSLSFDWNFGAFTSDSKDCPFCIIQQYIAWIQPSQSVNSSAGFVSSIFASLSDAQSGSFTWSTEAPLDPGVYYIGAGGSLDYQFNPNQAGYFGALSDTGPNMPNSLTAADGYAPYMVTVVSPLPVPGPLPLFGAVAAFGCSRKLRQRVRAAANSGGTTSPFN